MFHKARIKLTIYYLSVIMVISLFFSIIVYRSLTFELNRIENNQRIRRPNPVFVIDPEIIKEAKQRIFFSLLTLNVTILGVSGVSGYFLAGKTLDPISKMVDEQKEFISNASHELRTPLASIKAQIEVGLRDKKLSVKDSREILNSTLEDVNNMSNLANYLLKLNKFQTINNGENFKKIELSKVIKSVVGKNDQIKLVSEKTFILGDADAITELFSIIINNAVKYGENKPIKVEIKKNKTVSITDNGIGISESDLPHIFDKFYRADKVRNKDGYGLGLSIAKQIVENHNAKIKVVSKLGKGSTFKVIFS